MSNKNALVTVALALTIVATWWIVEDILEQRAKPIESEEAGESEESVEPEEIPLVLQPRWKQHLYHERRRAREALGTKKPVEVTEPVDSSYNPLYQYGYGEPNEPDDPTPEPIDPRMRVLNDGWIIMVDPNGTPGAAVEPLRKKPEAKEDDWKHRA